MFDAPGGKKAAVGTVRVTNGIKWVVIPNFCFRVRDQASPVEDGQQVVAVFPPPGPTLVEAEVYDLKAVVWAAMTKR